MAGVVRNMIRNALTSEGGPAQKRLRNGARTASVQQRHPWVGICKDGPQTDASLADEYLYGESGVR